MEGQLRKKRMLWLDGARGIAALCILIFHVAGGEFWFFSNLYIAVDFFFVLSGFVLAESLSQIRTREDISKFIIRRYLRIFPMLLATLVFSATYDLVLLVRSQIFGIEASPLIVLAPLTVIFSLSFLQIFYTPAVLVNFPVWSLSAEWVVNVLTSLFKSNATLRISIGVLLGFSLIVLSQFYDLELLNQLGRAFWGFSIGVLTYQKRLYLIPYKRSTLWMISLGVVLYFFASEMQMLQALVMVWPFAFLILRLAETNPVGKITTILERAGIYSYGFYLWHFPILGFTGLIITRYYSSADLDTISGLFVLATSTTLFTIIAVKVSLKFIEVPLRRSAQKRFGL